MTSDIVERLRAKHDDTWPQQIGYGDLYNQDGPDAADEIERLRKERDDLLQVSSSLMVQIGELVEALEAYLADCSNEECEFCIKARSALRKAKGEA